MHTGWIYEAWLLNKYKYWSYLLVIEVNLTVNTDILSPISNEVEYKNYRTKILCQPHLPISNEAESENHRTQFLVFQWQQDKNGKEAWKDIEGKFSKVHRGK